MNIDLRKYIEKNNMFDKNETIVLALSGGVDSMVLFNVLTTSDLDLKIIETNNGVMNNSSLSEVILQPGKNIIKVRFDDGIKHTLKLHAYEAK